MTVKETLDVINELIDYQILDAFAFTTVRYLHTDENAVILSDLVTDVRDWVNSGHEDATVEDVENLWNIVPGTFKNFIKFGSVLDFYWLYDIIYNLLW